MRVKKAVSGQMSFMTVAWNFFKVHLPLKRGLLATIRRLLENECKRTRTGVNECGKGQVCYFMQENTFSTLMATNYKLRPSTTKFVSMSIKDNKARVRVNTKINAVEMVTRVVIERWSVQRKRTQA